MNKPIAYFSKKLSPCETRCSITDKEDLAIVLACQNYHHFLWGAQFTVVTDHQPLTNIFKQKTKSPRMNRWVLEIWEYNYNIQYLKGKYSCITDQLSCPVHVHLKAPGLLSIRISSMRSRKESWFGESWWNILRAANYHQKGYLRLL